MSVANRGATLGPVTQPCANPRAQDAKRRPTTLPELSAFIATSLDGRIAAEGGSLDWLTAAARPDEDYGYDAFLRSVDALAMGRRTYDHIADHEPLPFHDKPVYVFTHRAPRPRRNVTFWSVRPDEAMAAWADAGLSHVYVDGGQLISDFLAAGLVDTLTITTAPCILGSGAPLFARLLPSSAWSLLGSQAYPSGMVTSTYRRT